MEKKLNGKVLVADDNASNQMLMQVLLKKMGLETVIVGHGKAVLEKMIDEKFDIILMDIQMPVMDGFEATMAIRKSGNDIPIIALTASTSESGARKCFECGCNEHLGKPIKKDVLFEAMAKYLNANEQTQAASTTSKGKLNEQAFISAISGDTDLQPVIDVFMEDLPSLLENINNANTDDDVDLIKNLAHELKGASGCAGFEVLEEYSAELEKTVLEGELDTAKKTVDQINNFCQILINKQST